MLSWLRGERSWYDEDEKRHRRVQLIDFEHPGANVFHVIVGMDAEAAGPQGQPRGRDVSSSTACRSASSSTRTRRTATPSSAAIKQLRRYEIETPELIGAPQLFNVTHLLDYWYGVTWNATRRDMARWKQTPDEAYRFAVQAFFEPTDFLRTLQHWILFYVEDSETRKSVLRQHQRRAIDKIVARCADPTKKRGLIWHTQGSGKTFTLLTAARLILEDKAALPERDGHPRRRPHRARRPAQGLGRAAAGRDAEAGHRRRARRTPRPSCRTCSTPTSAA